MKFSMEITLGNDAMQTLADVAKSFADAMNNFSGSGDPLEEGDGYSIRDRNGNKVGHWVVLDDAQ